MTHITIGCALLLLSLAAGMHLLAKTKKEELGNFFQAISWIIISLSILGILVTSVRTIAGGGQEIHKRIEVREGGRMHHEMQYGPHGPKHMKIEKRFDHCEKKCNEGPCMQKCSESSCSKKDAKAYCSEAKKKSCCKKKDGQKEEVKVGIKTNDKE